MLSHAQVTVFAPSGRRIVQLELPGIGEDDPYVLDTL